MTTESDGSIRVEVKCKKCGEEFVLYSGRFDQYAAEAVAKWEKLGWDWVNDLCPAHTERRITS